MSALDDELLDLFRFAAERSILPRWQNLRSDQIEEKAKGDLVTVVDQEVEEFLSEALTKLQPGVAIVGEEAAHSDPSVLEQLSGPCWIIDPIDGTSNFARGEGHFAIMLALADGGETIASWIYDPVRPRLLTARKGGGAFRDGDPVKASSDGETPPTLSAMTKFMNDEQRALFVAEIVPHYTLATAPGAAAEEYPRVAFGGTDIAIYERTLPWDHAAGCLFLNEAGGVCARQDGSPYRVDSDRKGMIAAASQGLWDEFVARLETLGFRPGG
ncbi:inositol monophosphatase family protein [Erythrobacter litoralis]|uniref:Fructose-1,6-bisphosphatase n=1 Tax=Erythrobacter litoralis (strain HTCC2594) TaxID=314225 RepID=Q2NB33_ERYLH|nr:inositol monophosphatase [Erythrobacter litoralis]ABC63108.1 fructose-1,6-bisphosphatase [Erythrobacter litoralis HTCC2594]